jgi:hypothetical protein
MLSAYLDESADKQKKVVLCVGGIVAADPFLQGIQDSWKKRLELENVPYFRYSDCKGLHGSFFHFRKRHGASGYDRAEKLMRDLEDILLSTSWIGFGMGVIIQEYKKVISEFPGLSTIYLEDPNESAYGQMMYEIARAVRKNAPGHQVAYLVDESSDYPKIAGAFRATKINHPIVGRTMTTVSPLNDKVVPSLQMADLVLGKIRESFARWMSDRTHTLNEDWSDEWNAHISDVGIWNRAHMLRGLRATLTKAQTGNAALRPPPTPSLADIRKQERIRRKSLRNKTV